MIHDIYCVEHGVHFGACWRLRTRLTRLTEIGLDDHIHVECVHIVFPAARMRITDRCGPERAVCLHCIHMCNMRIECVHIIFPTRPRACGLLNDVALNALYARICTHMCIVRIVCPRMHEAVHYARCMPAYACTKRAICIHQPSLWCFPCAHLSMNVSKMSSCQNPYSGGRRSCRSLGRLQQARRGCCNCRK